MLGSLTEVTYQYICYTFVRSTSHRILPDTCQFYGHMTDYRFYIRVRHMICRSLSHMNLAGILKKSIFL